MKSMKTTLIAISALAAISATGIAIAEPDKPRPTPEATTPEAPSPAELTATLCLTCHGNNQAGQQRLAPPFAMVKMHYQSLGEEAFIKSVSEWVKKPDKAKSKMPGAINHFGLMPAAGYPETAVAIVAKYIYQNEFSMPGAGRQGRGQALRDEACRPDTSATAKAGAECPEDCGPSKDATVNAEDHCATNEDNALTSATKHLTDTATAAKRHVPAPMMAPLLNVESDVGAFSSNATEDHANLARRIDRNLRQLISNFTMESDDHNRLHEWLIPFRELAAQHAASSDVTVQTGKVLEMRQSLKSFHERFEPAPQP